MNDVDARSAERANVTRAISRHDGDVVGAARAQRLNLALEQRPRADARQALRTITRNAAQAAAASRRQDDGSHAPSDTGGPGTDRPISSVIFET